MRNSPLRTSGLVSLSLLAWILLAALSPAPGFSAGDTARIEMFSPQGAVKKVRQVTARFSEPMVAFGDLKLGDPFQIQCTQKGEGRWIDARSWSYDFERDLPGGVACRFTLKAGLKTLEAKTVTGDAVFSFSTGGPAILRSNPYEGDRAIEEKQIFVLSLDAEPTVESLTKNVWFSVSGVSERVGITLVSGKEREQILKALRYDKKEGPVVTLRAKQSFPPSAKLRLIWGKGVAAKSGVSTEEDQVLEFKARGPFRAEFTCPREKKGGACIPVLPMEVTFSAPVAWSLAKEITLRSKDGKVWKPKAGRDDGDAGYKQTVRFAGPFPDQAEFTVTLPKGMKDDAGRPLANAGRFPLTVKTEAYPPLAKFAARFGIVEAANPLLPVTVRNIEAEMGNRLLPVEGQSEELLPDPPMPKSGRVDLPEAGPDGRTPDIAQQVNGRVRRVNLDQEERAIHWLRTVAMATRDKSVFAGRTGGKEFKLPVPGGGKPFEVIGIPLEKPGFYVVELESRILGSHLLGKPAPMYVPATALVTNLAAHFKWGRESSLVWVTALDTGNPVAGAAVSIRDCNGKRLWQGNTDERGVALIQDPLPPVTAQARCNWPLNYHETGSALNGINSGLFVFAGAGGDATFTHSSWADGIEPWRYGLSMHDEAGRNDVIAHTIFDRTLLRAGETVHMKHILRIPTTEGFSLPGDKARFDEITIRHGGSAQEYHMPISWQDGGSAVTDWKIPEGARLGTYDVGLSRKGEKTGAGMMRTGTFQVEEFRIPLMKAVVQGPADPVVQPKEVSLDLAVAYFSGGGAGHLPVKLRGEIRPLTVGFRGYDDYTFSGLRLKEGARKISPDEEFGPDEEATAGGEKPLRLSTQDLRLDGAGAARTKFGKLPRLSAARSLHAEMEYRDPNGEVQTAATDVPMYPAKLVVGLRPDSWAAAADGLRYRVVVLDLKGNPVAGSEVSVDLYRRNHYSHRKRIAGGFYSYEHVTEIQRIAVPCVKSDDAGMSACEAGPHCRGKTDASGMLLCEAPSPVSGNVILQAETKDEDGNAALANYNLWVAGKDDWWFEARNDDRIDVIPEKKRYEPGEKARLQVRMPFRDATALVTVEREGIVDVSVQKLSGKHPVVEIPVKRNYAPNAFVSVLVVRGRAADAAPTATFDPGKPAYKLGVCMIRVGWKAHELIVDVKPDRQVYRVRQEADVQLKVRTASGEKLPEQTELTVAAVDKGLLALRPNGSWRLLEAMMRQRPYEIFTATAQMMVVGKRHFGLKALPQGGGGGKQITRELFDTLLMWRATVPLDEKGEARLKIPLKDSLTEYRIVAVATGGADFFGTGHSDVRTTQELMLLAGVSPLAREGDFMRAGVTLRNTTQKAMNVEAKLSVTAGAAETDYETIPVGLSPGEAKEIGWDVKIPAGVDKLDYEISALERDGKRSDRLKVTQRVVPAVPVRTWQATLLQVRDTAEIPVEPPAGALAGKGGILVRLQPRIADGLDGVREYMSLYPYGCIEQKISKAVALKDKSLWQARMRELPSYLDDAGLLKYFPAMRTGSDTLTAYVLAIANEAGFEIPAFAKDRMSAGLTDFVEGRIRRGGELATADLAIRKVTAVEALSRYGKAKASLLGSVAVEPNLWPTSAVIDWIGVLKRVGDIPDRARKLTEAQQILRSRLNLQGTSLGFSTERADGLWWLMVSPDGNAVRTLLAVVDLDGWKEDAPRIAKGAIGRMRKGHWDTTTANAWGTLAFEKFSSVYETQKVSGKTTAALGPKTASAGWGFWETPAGAAMRFDWPAKKETLRIRHEGDGAPWATIQGLAAVPLRKPLSSGYRIKKTVTAVEKKVKNLLSRGDVLRVTLEVEAQSDMTWVVLSDPIPAGSAILTVGREPGSDRNAGYAREAYTERTFEACRFYYSYVPKGTWKTGYTLRLNNEGTFQLPPTRAEALYAPEMFGEIPNVTLSVNP